MDLHEITAQSHGVEIDLRYAKTNNVVKRLFYKREAAFLHPEASEKLLVAVKLAALQGYGVKLFDAFRPKEAQQILWDAYPDPHFISNPETGSCPHCRGVAVDLTLLDGRGRELDMGTDFDDFSDKAHHGNTTIDPKAQANRYMLMGIMTTAGWDFYRNEWWHYQLFNCRNYPLLTDKEAGTGLI